MTHNEKKGTTSNELMKLQIILALLATVLLVVVFGTLAWMNNQRTLQTITKMQMPVLWIKDKEDHDAVSIDLGNLDISNDGYKEIVFAVTATTKTRYTLQLAHTKNIPLNYSIYSATKKSDDTFEKVNEGLITGSLLNRESTKTETYGEYANVQVNSNPQYWQSNSSYDIEKDSYHYYVLRVDWSQAINNKETDVIYLTVSTQLSASGVSEGGSE